MIPKVNGLSSEQIKRAFNFYWIFLMTKDVVMRWKTFLRYWPSGKYS